MIFLAGNPVVDDFYFSFFDAESVPTENGDPNIFDTNANFVGGIRFKVGAQFSVKNTRNGGEFLDGNTRKLPITNPKVKLKAKTLCDGDGAEIVRIANNYPFIWAIAWRSMFGGGDSKNWQFPFSKIGELENQADIRQAINRTAFFGTITNYSAKPAFGYDDIMAGAFKVNFTISGSWKNSRFLKP